ncbi:MAG: addiction module protein [Bifidobacteriaceae bacterium]|jgi:hypothetical protein|nr:addiction module protein [Bifidobacteriaceae bacterium]
MGLVVNSRLLEQVTALSQEEQVEFIGAVWESLDHARLPVSASDREMLDEALADLEAHPDDGLPAAVSIARLRSLRA